SMPPENLLTAPVNSKTPRQPTFSCPSIDAVNAIWGSNAVVSIIEPDSAWMTVYSDLYGQFIEHRN
ncbi:hypothetical protein ACC808_37280, partial [Rhizobium ruizarguesonis]